MTDYPALVIKPRRSLRIITSALAITVIIIIAVLVTIQVLKPHPLLAKSITSKVDYVLLVPKSTLVKLDNKSVGYNSDLKLVDYQVSYSGSQLIVSQQQAPSMFSDVPETYNKTLASMNQYSQFDSLQGMVYLTKPQQLAGKQAAVLLSKGTLMFVKSSNSLSDDQWRLFFNTLIVN